MVPNDLYEERLNYSFLHIRLKQSFKTEAGKDIIITNFIIYNIIFQHPAALL
jgi:hypothetical protein